MPVRPLNNELSQKAQKELFEDPNRTAADIQHIQDWLAKQPHIRARTDDQWLVTFLRGCKYSLERTKEKLDLYYSVRTTAPELFKIKINNPLFDEILSMGCMIILPKLASPDAPRVSIIRPGKYDPDKYNILDVMSVSRVLEKILLMEDDNAVVAGIVTILDLSEVKMGHFLQMSPSLMKRAVVVQQDAMPIRMKGTHYLNIPGGFETVFNAVKSLLNEKNRNRLYVHNKNYDEMYKYIPQDILPEEYGGNGGTIPEIIGYWRKKVQEYKDFLEEDETFGTDESKRPGKPKTAEDMFGTDGSFRQLDFD